MFIISNYKNYSLLITGWVSSAAKDDSAFSFGFNASFATSFAFLKKLHKNFNVSLHYDFVVLIFIVNSLLWTQIIAVCTCYEY